MTAKPLSAKLLAQWAALCEGSIIFEHEGKTYETDTCARFYAADGMRQFAPPNPTADWFSAVAPDINEPGANCAYAARRPGTIPAHCRRAKRPRARRDTYTNGTSFSDATVHAFYAPG